VALSRCRPARAYFTTLDISLSEKKLSALTQGLVSRLSLHHLVFEGRDAFYVSMPPLVDISFYYLLKPCANCYCTSPVGRGVLRYPPSSLDTFTFSPLYLEPILQLQLARLRRTSSSILPIISILAYANLFMNENTYSGANTLPGKVS